MRACDCVVMVFVVQLRYFVSEGVGMGSHQKGTIHIRPSTVIKTKEEEVWVVACVCAVD